MYIKLIFILLSISIMASCNSNKSSTDAVQKNNETLSTTNDMTTAGFVSGVIVSSDEVDDCPFTIKMEGQDDYLLDPINLEDTYKKEGEKVWFKYTPLRMMNRCDKANPVSIEEMKMRE